jgi:hypothetical protein
MKTIIALFLAAATPLCAGFAENHKLIGAKYGYTAMTDNGGIDQIFFTDSGRRFRVFYIDVGKSSQIFIYDDTTGRAGLDVRKNRDAADFLRQVLRDYLCSNDTNERARSDVASALCLIDEPLLPTQSMNWFGSRGKVPAGSELGKIMANQAPEPTPTAVTPPAGQEARQP